jgi:hypothetical protein
MERIEQLDADTGTSFFLALSAVQRAMGCAIQQADRQNALSKQSFQLFAVSISLLKRVKGISQRFRQ